MGNEYIYIQDSGKQTITTKGMKAEIRCVEKNTFRTVVEDLSRNDDSVWYGRGTAETA